MSLFFLNPRNELYCCSVPYNSKNLNFIGRCLFYDSKRSNDDVFFFKSVTSIFRGCVLEEGKCCAHVKSSV